MKQIIAISIFGDAVSMASICVQVTQALDAAQKVPKAPLSELFTDVYDEVTF